VSLIFDALRKLEREKEAREAPGVVVVGSVPWGEAPKRRLGLFAALAVVALIAGAAGFALLRPAARAPEPSAQPVPAPAAAASPSPGSSAPSPVSAGEAAAEQPAAPPIRLSRPPELLTPASPPPAEAGRPPASTRAAAPPAEGHERSPRPEAAVTVAPAPTAAGSTEAPGAAAPAPDGLRLHAISQRDGRPVALINDRLVFEGDSFDGVRVVRIGETEVELEVRGERRLLRF
jgi:hypothetical protein